MTNNQERARIRAARYEPSLAFEAGLNAALKKLPSRKRRTAQEKYLMAAGLVAAFVLFCVFAAPPIVRAAVALVERVFGANIQKIEQYQALSDDEKLRNEIANVEKHSRSHDVDAVAAFKGVTVTLTGFGLRSEDGYDESRADGYMAVTLEYSVVPSFDPNWMDFTLAYDGVAYPAELGDGIMAYRALNLHATTEDDWWGGDFAWYSNSQIEDGRPKTDMSFPLPDWKFDVPTQFVLRGAIDGESFEIPFTFDPALAHEQAVAEAMRNAAFTEERNREMMKTYTELDEHAAPIGLTGTAHGIEYVLSEIAYQEGELDVSASFNILGETDEAPAHAKLARFIYHFGEIYTDGYPTTPVRREGEAYGDGAYTTVQYSLLCRDPDELPEESLVAVQLVLGEREWLVPLAFRYNWAEHRVTLPEDDAQMQTWLEQSSALRSELAARTPYQTVYDLKPLALTQTINGLRVALTAVEIDAFGMRVGYALRRDASFKGARAIAGHCWEESGREYILDHEATIDGHIAQSNGGSEKDNVPVASQFYMPLHPTQVRDGMPMTVKLPFRMLDRKGKEVYREIFEFSFALDHAAMNARDIWEDPSA